MYALTTPIIQSAAEALRPPKKVTVAEGAARTLVIRQPGGYSGPWSATEAPYMIEPMNMLASRAHEAVCFVGPARSSKTMSLVDGWASHVICHDPGDMLITQMTREKAREYSKTRIDRAIRYSPEIKSRMSVRATDDNTFDKLTKHGMWLKIGWPSASQLSSSDYRYVAMTDYDRMPDNIEGEGAPFSLGLKRTQTYLSRGMCVIESSPGRDYEDPHWHPSTKHEAPPCDGILAIYNSSDRRRWYWRCPDCGMYFEAKPGLELFATLPPELELMDIVRIEDLSKMAKAHAKVCCPHCGSEIESKHKTKLNDYETARWVADGQSVTVDGEVVGEHHQSTIAGYWLGGVAAAYQSWESILRNYLQALREYVLTGSDNTLKSKINVDQSMPYLPRHLVEDGDMQVQSRAEDMERYIVPEWTRFLLASVDVQGGTKARFEVQVQAIGRDMESAVIDRYSLTQSPRGENIRLDPAAYPEDWDVLTDRVVNSTYRIDGEKELRVLHTIVDYGGEAGVSVQAAAWRRKLKAAGIAQRVSLGKGDGKQKDHVQRTLARDKQGRRMRDVPLLMFSPDAFKDIISAAMRRPEPGPAYIHFPKWLKSWYYDELKSEVRDKNGKWKKIRTRNESFDLLVMIWALAYYLGPADPRREFNWDKAPAWAQPLAKNSEVISKDQRKAMKRDFSADKFKVF